MGGRPKGEDLGLQRAGVAAGEVRRVWNNTYVNRMCREDGQKARVRRNDKLSNVICDRRFDRLAILS